MRFILGCDSTSIHADITNVPGVQAPSYPTVTRWVARFKDEGTLKMANVKNCDYSSKN